MLNATAIYAVAQKSNWFKGRFSGEKPGIR
jgi:hypothetical protein